MYFPEAHTVILGSWHNTKIMGSIPSQIHMHEFIKMYIFKNKTELKTVNM